jgi:hypothetical protein
MDFKKKKSQNFCYQQLDENYILKSQGLDLVLNTGGDISPDF